MPQGPVPQAVPCAIGAAGFAFAHLVTALALIGPLRDPVRNVRGIVFGLVACAGVPLLALVAGHVRGIPLGWRLIDCSFGLVCGVPLAVCLRLVGRLADAESHDAP